MWELTVVLEVDGKIYAKKLKGETELVTNDWEKTNVRMFMEKLCDGLESSLVKDNRK